MGESIRGQRDFVEAAAGAAAAVCIDAIPHLVAADAQRGWELLPCWNPKDQGRPSGTGG